MNPKYPVYIPSKGRWESRLTVKALEEIGVPYHIVVEPQEYDHYAKVIDPKNILTLPFNDKGLVPSRNWIFEHALTTGAKRHWQLDDNISGFVRLNHNRKIRVASGTIFRCCEDFTDRYTNIAISGMNYRFFAEQRSKQPPFRWNRRIYSCSLINNSIPYRYRDVYNDDTDICLRALKDGWCTVIFQAFLCDKAATMTVKGGLNTEKYYQSQDGRLKMAQSLVRQHPDVARISWKWGRWQHHVDYSPFAKNKPILRDDIVIKQGVDNYGMKLMEVKE